MQSDQSGSQVRDDGNLGHDDIPSNEKKKMNTKDRFWRNNKRD